MALSGNGYSWPIEQQRPHRPERCTGTVTVKTRPSLAAGVHAASASSRGRNQVAVRELGRARRLAHLARENESRVWNPSTNSRLRCQDRRWRYRRHHRRLLQTCWRKAITTATRSASPRPVSQTAWLWTSGDGVEVSEVCQHRAQTLRHSRTLRRIMENMLRTACEEYPRLHVQDWAAAPILCRVTRLAPRPWTSKHNASRPATRGESDTSVEQETSRVRTLFTRSVCNFCGNHTASPQTHQQSTSGSAERAQP